MAELTPRDVLLAPQLDPEDVLAFFRARGFADPCQADANLQALADGPRARELLAEMADELFECLGRCADPDQALTSLERYSVAALNKVGLLSYLRESPRALELLVIAFGASPFMVEILIRDPGYLYWVAEPDVLDVPRSTETLASELNELTGALRSPERRLAALRVFKRKEILHIAIRDLLRLASVTDTLAALSALAKTLIACAVELAQATLASRLARAGFPIDLPAAESGFAVIGLGKLGGDELNFSSDVDLLYVYGSDREPAQLTRGLTCSLGAFYTQLAQRVTAALGEATQEGSVYRVDLRLRPEGKQGRLVISLEAFAEYLRERAAPWERLAFIRAQCVGGDRTVGNRFLEIARAYAFGPPLGPDDLAHLRQIKAQIDRQVSERGQRHTHVKLGLGGIREIELIAQALQASFGRSHPRVCEPNTLAALAALEAAGLLFAPERSALTRAYHFLRDVENKLQMVYDSQVHALPQGEAALRQCALRLGYRDQDGQGAQALFLEAYQRETAQVHQVFEAVFAEDSSRFAPKDDRRASAQDQ